MGRGGEAVVEHEGDDENSDQRHHGSGKTVTPGAEDVGHFLLMRSAAGIGGVVADPCGAVEDGAGDRDDQCEDVEIAQFLDVHRVEEAFSGRAVEHDRRDVAEPGDVRKNEDREDHEDRITDDSLEAVRHQERNTSRRPDDRQCENQQDRHQHAVGRNFEPENRQFVRDSEKVNEEPHRHGRSDGVGDHLCESADDRRHNTEGTAVTLFEELAGGEAARLAEPVHAITAQRHEKTERNGQVVPETHGHAALIILFAESDQRDDRKTGTHVSDADDVTTGDATGSEIIGDVPDVSS